LIAIFVKFTLITFCFSRLERDLPGRMDQFGVELRERLKWDIREAMIGAESFIPKHTIIATWKNVTFAGGLPQAIKTVRYWILLFFGIMCFLRMHVIFQGSK